MADKAGYYRYLLFFTVKPSLGLVFSKSVSQTKMRLMTNTSALNNRF